MINKPQPGQGLSGSVVRLRNRGPGLSLSQFARFEDLAPRGEDGEPTVVGPCTNLAGQGFESVRVGGVSRSGVIPRVHAKLLVIGTTITTDEHPSGHVVEDSLFRPHKVWLGSANFTWNSRGSLEFGAWSDDTELMRHVTGFLVDLLSYSEPFTSTNADADPELVEYEIDDDAMREAYAGLDRELKDEDEDDEDEDDEDEDD